MKTIGSIKTSNIGKFRSLDDVKLYDRIKKTQDQVDDVKDSFLRQDNSESDFNSEDGVVLLDGKLSGFLDNTKGSLEAKTFSHSTRLAFSKTRDSRIGRAYTVNDTTRYEHTRTEDEDRVQWETSTSFKEAGSSYEPRGSVRVVEDKQNGTLTLLKSED